MKWTTEKKVGAGVLGAGILALVLAKGGKPPPPPGPIVLDGYIKYGDTGEPAGEQWVELNEDRVKTDEDGYFAFPSLSKGQYVLKCQLNGYNPFVRTLTITKSVTVNISLQVVTGDFYVSWMTVTPKVVVLGQAVEIEADIMTRGKFGEFRIECSIDGETLYKTAIFSESQWYCNVAFAFTPTRTGNYTASLLGFVGTFKVVPSVVGHFECPFGPIYPEWWSEPPYLCHHITESEYRQFVDELTSEELLAKHIGLVGDWHEIWGVKGSGHAWYEDTNLYKLYCPYCDWRFLGQEGVDVGYKLLDHIKLAHALWCPICDEDLTFAAFAHNRVQAWIEHMGAHGITMPVVNIAGVSSDIPKDAAASASEWIREVGASLCVLGQGKPAFYHFDSSVGEGVPIVEDAIAEIPALEGKNWTAALGSWCKGYQYYKEPPIFGIIQEISGSGYIVAFEDVATFSDWGNRYFGLTLIVQVEGDTLVVPNAWALIKKI